MPSGQHVTQVAAGPVQWRDRNGRWHEFSLDLRPGDGVWRARAGRAAVELPTVLGMAGAGITLSNRDGDELGMLFVGRPTQAQVFGSEATYREVADGVDLRLQVVPEGLKEDIVLAGPHADRRLAFRITAPGLTVDQRRGMLRFRRGERTAFAIPRPVLIDANGAMTADNGFQLRQVAPGEWELTVVLDDAWLKEMGRAWPVAVDPTANVLVLDAVDDCQWFWSPLDDPSPVCNVGPERFVGQTAALDSSGLVQIGMPRLSFGPSLTLVPTDTIESATLRLHRLDSQLVDPAGSITRAWSHDVLVLPALTRYDMGVNYRGVRGAPIAPGTAGPVESDVTELARQWQLNELTGGTEGIANEGFRFVHNEHVRFRTCTQILNTCDWTRFASAQHPDPELRPVLEVRSWPAAPAGSAVISPREGELTGRFMRLQARALHSSVTDVQFQYVAGSGRRWQDIPLSALRSTAREPLASTVIPVSGPTGDRRSQMVVWDLSATPDGDIDGPVHVRAYLNSPWFGQGGMTDDVGFRLDRNGIARTASTDLGPGELDLVSGEFSLTETDATHRAFLQDLTLSRTYSSRGVSRRNYDMFGPGWEANIDPDGGELPYKNIYNFSKIEDEVVERQEFRLGDFDWENFLNGFLECVILAEDEDAANACLAMRGSIDYSVETISEIKRWEYRYAVLELGDGRKTTFTQTVDPNGQVTGWVPADDIPGYRLEYARTETAGIFEFVLTEPGGGVARFRSEIANSPNHRIQSYRQPGSPSALSYTYEASGGRQRLKRVTAPTPTGGTAHWMELSWSDIGAGTWRVTSVSVGSGASAGTTVAQYAYNANKRLARAWDPRISPALVTEYAYDTRGLLNQVGPPGEEEWRLAYTQHAGDVGPRLESMSRDHPNGGTAVNTVRYGVPLSGSGAPYDMSPAETARWGQVDDLPWDAVAIFPADDVPTGSTPDYGRATIHYLDLDGREVNVAEPGGHISTVEHDANGNVIRLLTAENRVRALAAGAASANVANDLSTVNLYSPDGVDLVATYEPRTEIELASGRVVTGRRVTTTHYDQGAPAGGPYHLPTSKWRAVEISPGYRADQREMVRYSYDAPTDGVGGMSGWRARTATRTTVDPGGRRLVSQQFLHPDYPIVEETRTPRGADGGARPEVRYRRYANIGSRRVPAGVQSLWGCGRGAPSGFLCLEADNTYRSPIIDGAKGKLPRTYTYNVLGLPTEIADYFDPGLAPRTASTTYDTAGRVTRTSVAGGQGTAVPETTVTYSSTTGRETGVSAPGRGTIARVFDSNGRLQQYTDASGLVTRSTYDLRGRVRSTVEDDSRTTTYGYDDRDNLVSVTDPDAGGAITAAYDADGQLIRESLPNGIEGFFGYDVAGYPSTLRWEKMVGCTRDCVWVRSDITARDADGKITGHETTGSRQTYRYDTAGRLERVDDIRAVDQRCVREQYAYDVEYNRTSRDETVGTPSAACGTGATTSRSWTHDNANRITNMGWRHDAYGRATDVPAPDSGGRGALRAVYYADDLVRQLTLDGRSHTYDRDPLGRTSSVVSTGGSILALTSRHRYADDSDTPVATTRSDSTTARNIGGPSGQLVAIKDGATLAFQLRDVHGSIVATAPATGSPDASTSYNPFGAVVSPTPNVVDWAKGTAGYGWLGAHQRTSEFEQFEGAAPPMEMGVRVYLPAVGRFLQVDPVEGGSANDYEYALQDPVNLNDLDGKRGRPAYYRPWCTRVGKKTKCSWRVKRPDSSGFGVFRVVGSTVRAINRWVYAKINPFNPHSSVSRWVHDNAPSLGDLFGCGLSFKIGKRDYGPDLCQAGYEWNRAHG
ncbi:RHS repeat protein [Conexibacter arvalis]|uniref:RHS repeat-associated protein n=1 Tax=Conexibacter arvalis TaxID=912552 RepID=A0A840IDQ6_9ACTN|nr:RHS repeat protein [Conexibacter arvalis]MBB4662204.1 RHS repeat-associated protein [Conexibacter arvalis]